MQVCPESEAEEVLLPTECLPYMQPSPDMPFTAKHARQQASIVGHMKQAGLLKVNYPAQAQLTQVKLMCCFMWPVNTYDTASPRAVCY